MKTITKIISLIILGVAMVGCTIVIPAAETANNKAAPTTETEKPDYQRPNPTPPPGKYPRETAKPAYQRPTPIPPSGISSKETGSEEKIEYPSRNNNINRAVSDTTKQRPKRRRK